MMQPRSLRWLLVPLAALALWLGVRWLQTDDAPVEDKPRAARRERLVFQNGTWMRADRDVQSIFRALASRAPGMMRISGTVRDDSGAPVAAAEVVFASGLGEQTTETDDSGQYTIEVPAGFYRAFARADGYVAVGTTAPERLPSTPDASQVGTPRDDLAPLIGVFRDQSGVDMQLVRGATIVGTVYDGSGRPVAGAVITGLINDYLGGRTRLVLGTDVDESDLDGSFRLEVPAGGIQLTATHEDFAGLSGTSSSFVYAGPGDTVRVDLTLTAGCIISGQVVDSRGERAGDGSLELWNGGEPPNDFYPAGTITAGRFRLARTEAGRVRLRAWLWKSPPTVTRDFDCEDGARYHGVTLVVPEADPDLEGSVWSRNGEPMAGAYLDAIPQDMGGMAQQERADAFGEWSFYSLPPGRYQVMAYVPGHGAASQVVTVPSRGVRLTLSGTGAISGVANGMDSGTITVAIERCAFLSEDTGPVMFGDFQMAQATRLVPVEGGSFYIDDLPACALRLLITAAGTERRVSVNVEAGGTVPLSVDLRAPWRKTVYGVFVDADGVPMAGARVVRMPGPGSPPMRTQAESDVSGRYELEAYAGDMLLFIDPQGEGQSVASVSWSDGEREQIDMTLSD